MEFIGGIAFLLGIGVGVFSVPLAITMLVASFVAHGGAFDSMKNGMEYPLTLAVSTLVLGLLGPGRYVLLKLSQPRFSKLLSLIHQ